MAYLLDTNVLVRLADMTDPLRAHAAHAILELHRRAEVLHITPQNLVEFWNVATRPANKNGLGLSGSATRQLVADFERGLPLLEDSPDILPAWKGLVIGLSVVGKQAHDARLVAVCHVHGITHFLTFNTAHFTRFATFGPGLAIVDPRNA